MLGTAGTRFGTAKTPRTPRIFFNYKYILGALGVLAVYNRAVVVDFFTFHSWFFLHQTPYRSF